MKVHEMIEKLKEMPQDMEVCIPDDECSYLEAESVTVYKYDDISTYYGENGELLEKRTPVEFVFIFWCDPKRSTR